MENECKSLAIIIPAYNAESSLVELINRIRAVSSDVKIIVVDDGSTDATKEISEYTGAIVLHHINNRGKGAALQTGFDYVKRFLNSEFICTMDADLQHKPEDIPKFISAQKQFNADIIIGWRKRAGTNMPLSRMLSNTITSAMVGMRIGIKIKDSQCGFRLIKRKAIETINLETTGYEAETEFLIKAAKSGFKIDFVPIQTIYGNEKSYMTHWLTTKNFIKVLFKDYV